MGGPFGLQSYCLLVTSTSPILIEWTNLLNHRFPIHPLFAHEWEWRYEFEALRLKATTEMLN